ncbi:TetR/AcrR family transcriptional regulator [Providencia rettgeri]|uniref:TetR/AcrR family transcriptional regulator n=3 Tax=Providencia TaxID=586 RepID=A0AA42K1D0_9GAMM|nr:MULTISPECIES: TetR/AcrR family transcriptional regulator [Providencia]MBC8652497.1 TetR/AcrR family transcriptional regulator [Providencia vermicola]EIL1984129.1 TetR/AcrR family transcriptional regulator [Providencia rettgeri]EIL1985332.1 TetR/AcrR family transcriptional regulator [Providencia rettgeri]EIU7555560.1 TetR/AcrR family transcriptional regulator [Providencia rettgeri]EIU7559692.1 TetR/AcrR family transcriptional regulator [Providencia rettgeri]
MTLPPKKPRTKPAEERLDDLMNAAEKLFLSKGFVSTTVSEIVLSADVAKGTFYHYFQSKNDIMEALRTRYMDWYLGHIQTALDSQTSACEKLKAWCENSVKYYVEKQNIHDMLFHDEYHGRSNDHETRAVEQIKTILAFGEQNKAWPELPKELMSTMIYHSMHAAVDNLSTSTEYNQHNLGQILYQRFSQLLK